MAGSRFRSAVWAVHLCCSKWRVKACTKVLPLGFWFDFLSPCYLLDLAKIQPPRIRKWLKLWLIMQKIWAYFSCGSLTPLKQDPGAEMMVMMLKGKAVLEREASRAHFLWSLAWFWRSVGDNDTLISPVFSSEHWLMHLCLLVGWQWQHSTVFDRKSYFFQLESLCIHSCSQEQILLVSPCCLNFFPIFLYSLLSL